MRWRPIASECIKHNFICDNIFVKFYSFISSDRHLAAILFLFIPKLMK